MPDTIDVSFYQHPGGAPIDWAKVKAAGVKRVYVQLTYGSTGLNPFAKGDIAGAHAEELEVGAYHFAYPAQSSGPSQATRFVAATRGLPLSLPHALDLEEEGGLTFDQLAQWAESWHTTVDAEPGSTAHYTDEAWRTELPGCPWGRKLWLAAPDATEAPAGTWLWQRGPTQVDGIEGNVDADELVEAPTPAPPPAPAPVPVPPATVTVTLPELREQAPPYQDQAAVHHLQQLTFDHVSLPSVADGMFGPNTDAAVRTAQQRLGLAADGIVGPLTWEALLTR